MRSGFFLLFMTFAISIVAQKRVTDSLELVLKTAKEDTGKVITLNFYGRCLIKKNDYKGADSLFKLTEKLARQLNYITGITSVLYNRGVLSYRMGELPEAIDFYTKGLELTIKNGNRKGEGKCLSGLGLVYSEQGDYPKAIEYNLKALKVLHEIGDRDTESDVIGNLGGVYCRTQEFERAIEYYTKMIKIKEELGDKYAIALNTGNIGIIYAGKNDYGKALEYFNKSYQLSVEIGNKRSIALSLGNTGNVYMNKGFALLKKGEKVASDTMLDRAIIYDSKALKIQQELGDVGGEALNLTNLGSLLTHRIKYNESERALKKAEEIATEIGYLDVLQGADENLYDLYYRQGRYDLALKYFKKGIQIRDSVFSEENTKKTVRLEMNYEFEKKEAATKLEQEKKEAVAAAESKKQRIIIWSVSGILILVIAFAVFAYRSYLQKQKANLAIIRQKEIIEEKQKEILDSIHYARRIQTALLPTEKYIERNMNVLNKKDVQ